MKIRPLPAPLPASFALTLLAGILAAQPLPKAAVAEKIRQVENGVDEFKNYLERRGENARNAAGTAQQSGKTARRRGSAANTEARQAAAQQGKDDLEDAIGDLDRSTNRLRRKFDATDTWMETKVQVERVVDDGRRINQVVARGNYGAEVARVWAVLRNSINDLARAYGVPPMGV